MPALKFKGDTIFKVDPHTNILEKRQSATKESDFALKAEKKIRTPWRVSPIKVQGMNILNKICFISAPLFHTFQKYRPDYIS